MDARLERRTFHLWLVVDGCWLFVSFFSLLLPLLSARVFSAVVWIPFKDFASMFSWPFAFLRARLVWLNACRLITIKRQDTIDHPDVGVMPSTAFYAFYINTFPVHKSSTKRQVIPTLQAADTNKKHLGWRPHRQERRGDQHIVCQTQQRLLCTLTCANADI